MDLVLVFDKNEFTYLVDDFGGFDSLIKKNCTLVIRIWRNNHGQLR